ncbi:MAG: FeoA family protein [Bacteroidota bacterium]
MKLSSIHSKEPYTIIHIEENELTHRLYDMGIFPNQIIEVIDRAPLGDPMVIQMDGQLIMLRLSEADLITIE